LDTQKPPIRQENDFIATCTPVCPMLRAFIIGGRDAKAAGHREKIFWKNRRAKASQNSRRKKNEGTARRTQKASLSALA
jgi:hypothetical protein